jgi:hypothetical protein
MTKKMLVVIAETPATAFVRSPPEPYPAHHECDELLAEGTNEIGDNCSGASSVPLT